MNSEPKLKIAIIQLTRIGDIVQTLQATRQFRAENPNTFITLIARQEFATGIKFLIDTVFDETILIETKDFFKGSGLESAKQDLGSIINQLNRKEFDVTVNLSFNKSASYLNSLIKSQLTLGMTRNNKSEIVINDKWSQYVYSNVMSSNDTPFNLVDIYRYILGCQDVHKLSNDSNVQRNKSIVLHPFASSKKKKWGINRWSEVIYKLAKDNPTHIFHIVGGPEDAPEAKRLIESPSLINVASRLHSHAGTAKLSDTYQLLQGASLFVGHDSVVSHIASETLTPSIVISLGTVRPFETTAYGENVINIAPRNKCYPCIPQESCELLPCHNSIGYQPIAAIGTGLINGSKINYTFLKDNISAFQLDSISVYKSEYQDQGLNLKEISSNHSSLKDVFKDYYKVIWQLYLRDHELNVALPDVSKECAESLYGYLEGVEQLFDLYSFGVKFSNRIIKECEQAKPNTAIIKESIEKLTEIDHLCNVTKKTYPHLAGLIDFFFVSKANAHGDDVIEISKANLLAYYDASNLTAVLNEFIEKSTSPHIKKNVNIQEV